MYIGPISNQHPEFFERSVYTSASRQLQQAVQGYGGQDTITLSPQGMELAKLLQAQSAVAVFDKPLDKDEGDLENQLLPGLNPMELENLIAAAQGRDGSTLPLMGVKAVSTRLAELEMQIAQLEEQLAQIMASDLGQQDAGLTEPTARSIEEELAALMLQRNGLRQLLIVDQAEQAGLGALAGVVQRVPLLDKRA